MCNTFFISTYSTHFPHFWLFFLLFFDFAVVLSTVLDVIEWVILVIDGVRGNKGKGANGEDLLFLSTPLNTKRTKVFHWKIMKKDTKKIIKKIGNEIELS